MQFTDANSDQFSEELALDIQSAHSADSCSVEVNSINPINDTYYASKKTGYCRFFREK